MNVNKILEIEIKKINPDKDLIKDIKRKLDLFINNLEKEIKKKKLIVDVFVGGSFAKGTVIKKDKYEIDLFLRYDKKYSGKISDITEELIKKVSNSYVKLHGSRDYFQTFIEDNVLLEIIPVIKIAQPKTAENITDLSYFHVNYVKKALSKNKKLADEIKIAKAFCHAQNCYGAESYIKGFSGYALELLVIHYGSFEKFLKEVLKSKDKIIIFNKKDYKNKNEILMNLNGSKLQSEIVLIDPTFKERNALAALSSETYNKFKLSASKFLKNPSESFFQVKGIDFDDIAKRSKKNKKDFVIVRLETDRQEGDIAGSKMLKFYNYLTSELERYFKIKDKGFEYLQEKEAKLYLIVEKKKEIIIKGPPEKMKKDAVNFRRRHKKVFVKNGKIYARELQNMNLKEFLKLWRVKKELTLEEMSIKALEIIN